MATLEETIRRRTGASSDDVSDQDIADSLARCSTFQTRLELDWFDVYESNVIVYKRARIVGAWGMFEPANQASTHVTVIQSDGGSVSGNWTLSDTGIMVFASNQSADTDIVVTAHTYDVDAACAEVVEQLLALCARDYDVKLGDQSFSRSQAVAHLTMLLDRFKRASLPAPLGVGGTMLVRHDDMPSPRRSRRRMDWR